MSYNNVGRLITSTIITLQHFATLHHTSLLCCLLVHQTFLQLQRPPYVVTVTSGSLKYGMTFPFKAVLYLSLFGDTHCVSSLERKTGVFVVHKSQLGSSTVLTNIIVIIITVIITIIILFQ